MSKTTLFFAVFLITILWASDVKVKVFSPENLMDVYKTREMGLTLANYGYVPYGKSLIGTLHLANPRNGCLPLEPFMTNNSHSDPSPIVVMERGDCHFVTKTHYAQLIGAKLALIIDNRDENEDYVIMIDDGFGHDISIPTIMISKEDGKNILKYLESNNTNDRYSVALSFHFDMPNPDDDVEYELWMSAMDEKSYDFLQDFATYTRLLGTHASFTPHYALWFCPLCKVNNFTNTPNPNCVSNGRYCAPDPDGDEGPLTGQQVVLEDLRQICLYSIHNASWWDYAVAFGKKCLNSSNLSACSEQVYTQIGFSKQEVNQCIKRSFGNSDNIENDNSLLSIERKSFLGEGIQIWPSIRINNITYRGNLVPSDGVFDAICEGLLHPIAACQRNNGNPISSDKSESGSGSVVGVVLLVIFALLIFMIIIMVFYKRWMRQEITKDIQLQVNTTISQYFALREERKV